MTISVCCDVATAYCNEDDNIPGKSGKQDDARSCQEECQKTERCKFWTFNKRNERCYLKTRRTKVEKGKKKFISGDKKCEVPNRLRNCKPKRNDFRFS